MATVESLSKCLDELYKDHKYFTIEEIVFALELPMLGESLFETLQREHLPRIFDRPECDTGGYPIRI
jgi:hypothetical protein